MNKKEGIKKILTCILMTYIITLSFKITYAINEEKAPTTNTIGISYQTHVQINGWQEMKKNGETSGTTNQAKRIEAIKIDGINLPEGVKIKYQTHVQIDGWQTWRNEGEIAGTTGQEKRIEAIRIKLENTDKYSIQYRTHIQDIGWQNWCEDGEISGTTGKEKRIEAIEIRIVEKEIKGKINIDTDLTNTTFDSSGIEINGWKMANIPNTNIQVYLNGEKIEANVEYSKDDTVINTIKGYGIETNNAKPRFNIKINPTNLKTDTYELELRLVDSQGKIIETSKNTLKLDKDTLIVKYQSQIQDIGWQNWVKNGETSGTTNKAKRLEAIKIDGINLPEGVEIKYQEHVSTKGWQTWKREGELAGTVGKSLSIEAIRIKLENTDKYSIQYRAYVQDIGWQDWCEDGEYAGTISSNKRLEAIQIKITEKIYSEKTRIFIDTSGSIKNTNGNIKGWVMSTVPDIKIKVMFDGNEIGNATRTERTDVLNSIKGYGGDITNPKPGFSINFDYSKQSLGNHVIKVEVWSNDNRKLQEASMPITIVKKIEYGTGIYGISGAATVGAIGGSELRYCKYGSGPNVFFATFCVHGFEDAWYSDGTYLTEIADSFYNQLVASQDSFIADKWTIYIFPEVNPDGRKLGYTNRGPGRLTLYSQVGRGIDINRSWQTGSSYVRYTDDRNYNGTAGFQAYEAAALRDFLLSHKSTSGQTVLVDLHGWENQLIGNAQIANYYKTYFPSCSTRNYESYGTQYIISWARQNLGAKVTLVELPFAANRVQANNMGLGTKYINATLQMLREV